MTYDIVKSKKIQCAIPEHAVERVQAINFEKEPDVVGLDFSYGSLSGHALEVAQSLRDTPITRINMTNTYITQKESLACLVEFFQQNQVQKLAIDHSETPEFRELFKSLISTESSEHPTEMVLAGHLEICKPHELEFNP